MSLIETFSRLIMHYWGEDLAFGAGPSLLASSAAGLQPVCREPLAKGISSRLGMLTSPVRVWTAWTFIAATFTGGLYFKTVGSFSVDPFHCLHNFLSNTNKLVYIAHFSDINMSLPPLLF